MAIDFPDNPEVGGTFAVGSVVYSWDGVRWNASIAAGPTGPKGEIGLDGGFAASVYLISQSIDGGDASG